MQNTCPLYVMSQRASFALIFIPTRKLYWGPPPVENTKAASLASMGQSELGCVVLWRPGMARLLSRLVEIAPISFQTVQDVVASAAGTCLFTGRAHTFPLNPVLWSRKIREDSKYG